MVARADERNELTHRGGGSYMDAGRLISRRGKCYKHVCRHMWI